ncbi:MAG: MBOAT family protein [Planctomycetales bacterium]|nr:MBOAT family protein [Planctomycetales bacterium]
MLFHTWPFLYFFAVVYLVFLCLRGTRYWQVWMLVASYAFYGYANPLYLLLIFYSTLLDYWCVVRMDRSARRGFWLGVSIFNNLLVLGFFKYSRFLLSAIDSAFLQFGLPVELIAPDWVPTANNLPVGISFFTFQSMSYTIDFYRGGIEREKSFLRFATFVSFFPQLVAGPIERASKLLPQLHTRATITSANVADGASLFITGLFKKVALSNYLSAYADPIFALPERHDGAALAAATFAFAWQIYFDFSGYTDMARGVARSMGFDLMLNFRNPYLANGISDFWSRWHISLSTWFRDYVYIPLGGNRNGTFFLYRNLFLTMFISGVWHGANWTYVIWGTIHGIAAVASRRLERSDFYRDRIPNVFKQIAVFLIVCIAWVYFRASSVSEANLIVTTIFTSTWSVPSFPLLLLSLILCVWIFEALSESRFARLVEVSFVKVLAASGMLVYLAIMPGQADVPFIYFQF